MSDDRFEAFVRLEANKTIMIHDYPRIAMEVPLKSARTKFESCLAGSLKSNLGRPTILSFLHAWRPLEWELVSPGRQLGLGRGSGY